jgi:hypothetical protein
MIISCSATPPRAHRSDETPQRRSAAETNEQSDFIRADLARLALPMSPCPCRPAHVALPIIDQAFVDRAFADLPVVDGSD